MSSVMVWLIGRMSAVFCILIAAALLFWIIPRNTGAGFGAGLSPSTMPTAAAWMIGFGGLLALFERSSRDNADSVLLRRSGLFLALVACAVAMFGLAGFVWVAPVLALSTMLMAGERRPVPLVAGATVIPFLLWLVVAIGLGRPLP